MPIYFHNFNKIKVNETHDRLNFKLNKPDVINVLGQVTIYWLWSQSASGAVYFNVGYAFSFISLGVLAVLLIFPVWFLSISQGLKFSAVNLHETQ